MNGTPQRIVCLSAEVADWLWRIRAWDRVVGVTAYFAQPPGVAPRRRVSGFSTAQLSVIEELAPDLVITFSDVQADLTADLMRRGINVLATNQRTLAEIEATLALLGRIVDCEREAARWLREFRERLAPVRGTGARPRVYFEEWNEPLITGIAWVGELIERAGGEDVFAGLQRQRSAPQRVVLSGQVQAANPEIIVASWCGRAVKFDELAARPGWSEIDAVRFGRMHELAGEDILQPGFRLVFGYERIKEFVQAMEVAGDGGRAAGKAVGA